MKLVLAAILGLTVFECSGLEDKISIVKYENHAGRPDGSYKWSYETANGIAAEEEAHLDNSNTLKIRGSYNYISPEGTPILINYSADEQGFLAQGDSIPQSPPIPAAIQRALDWNAAHPEEEVETATGKKNRISKATLTSLQG